MANSQKPKVKKQKENNGTIIAIGGCMMQEKQITDKLKTLLKLDRDITGYLRDLDGANETARSIESRLQNLPTTETEVNSADFMTEFDTVRQMAKMTHIEVFEYDFITGEKLEPNYLADVKLQANNAKTSADNAKTSEELAYQYAEDARQSASETQKNDAANITYSNATSGLTSNNVQGAIDELNDNLENELFIIDIIREEMTGNDLRLR